ncbi:hypothetical protein HNR02_006200 [Amycolatopsis endophytica]|uniref:Uncharacterized protein n=1 Tax=Amycolatopsis endophytica TaxID=860233 RepID=A0A853BDI0_9PSEU|nr:hypothetical protein [Amycolatopsis endophytica]
MKCWWRSASSYSRPSGPSVSPCPMPPRPSCLRAPSPRSVPALRPRAPSPRSVPALRPRAPSPRSVPALRPRAPSLRPISALRLSPHPLPAPRSPPHSTPALHSCAPPRRSDRPHAPLRLGRPRPVTSSPRRAPPRPEPFQPHGATSSPGGASRSASPLILRSQPVRYPPSRSTRGALDAADRFSAYRTNGRVTRRGQPQPGTAHATSTSPSPASTTACSRRHKHLHSGAINPLGPPPTPRLTPLSATHSFRQSPPRPAHPVDSPGRGQSARCSLSG